MSIGATNTFCSALYKDDCYSLMMLKPVVMIAITDDFYVDQNDHMNMLCINSSVYC